MANWKCNIFLDLRRITFFMCVSSLMLIIGNVDSACSPSCSSCVNDKCEVCLGGYYLNSTGDCLPCPDRCTSCFIEDYCYTCMAGYTGRQCTKPCASQLCVNDKCDIDSGHCTFGCIDGYLKIGGGCDPCESKCKTCVNFVNNCTKCKEGSYGVSCQYNCSYCKDGLCSKDSCINGCGDGYYMGSIPCSPCNTHCTSCSTFENCHACKDGYWGSNCQYACIECNTCNKDVGSCATEETTTSTGTSTINTPETDTFKTTSNIQQTSDTELNTEASSAISDISQHKCNADDNGLLYAAVIGWVLAVLLIGADLVLIAVVYKRRMPASQGHTAGVNVLPRDHESTSHDYTSLEMRTSRENENQYSVLQNPESVINSATVSVHNASLQKEHAGDHPPSSQHTDQYVGRHYMNT